MYSEYVKAFILYAKNKDLPQTKNLLKSTFQKDSTRFDIMQEVGKICYYMRDYKSASNYYKPFLEIRETYNLDVFRSEDAKIGFVLAEIGQKEEAEKLFANFKKYAENDQSIYKHINLAMYYSLKKKQKLAIEHQRLFSQQDNYHFWILVFIEIDPLIYNIKNFPEFEKVFSEIETKFWKKHKQMKTSLETKGLI